MGAKSCLENYNHVALSEPLDDTKELTNRYVVNAHRFGQTIRQICIKKEKLKMKDYEVREIKNLGEADPFILEIHYAKRKPSISYMYGLFDNSSYEQNRLVEIPELIGICSFGMSAGPYLSLLAGEKNKKLVIELNRLVLKHNRKNEASYLVSQSLKLLPKPKIVVSYADTDQNHLGIVYQACNFLFTGTTKQTTDMAVEEGKHARHGLKNPQIRVNRSPKHRYVYICADKKTKKDLLKDLTYPILKYPKERLQNDSINGFS